MIYCIIGGISSFIIVGFLAIGMPLKTENNMLKTQLETHEPLTPTGTTEPLTPETVMAIDMFCASWEEMK